MNRVFLLPDTKVQIRPSSSPEFTCRKSAEFCVKMKVLDCIQAVVVAPIGLAFFAVFIMLWAVWTLSGIGPMFQCYCNSCDQKKLNPSAICAFGSDLQYLTVSANVHSCSMAKPYRLCYSYMKPNSEESAFPPVCIPNGLGANLVLIRKLQEYLVAAGFSVLSFDRLGVGLSDENNSRCSPTASDVVAEMDCVMNAVQPKDTKWILLGPSMGSIVAQCYIARYPQKVVGFLNMDGLPYPFIQQKGAFAWAAFIYRMYASIVWTGILRPILYMARKDLQRMFGSRTFPVDIALALMNRRSFFANVALEMHTMIDCCAMAEREWDAQSLLRMPAAQLEVLVRAAPDESVSFDTGAGSASSTSVRTITLDRSPSELGAQWSTPEEVQLALRALLHGTAAGPKIDDGHGGGGVGGIEAGPTTSLLDKAVSGGSSGGSAAGDSPLLRAWRGLVVRVMSARNHDFGNAIANSFYTQEMRNTAAAEHAIHALCARNGRRTVYPNITHTSMFTHTEEIVRQMLEIAAELDNGLN